MRRFTLLPLFLTVACDPAATPDPPDIVEVCVLEDGESAEFLSSLGCRADFLTLASVPINSTLPGARTVKTVIDRVDNDELFFQNSVTYPIHWNFTRAHRSGNGLPLVGELDQFNLTEYYSPERRFILGALTHYEGPNLYVYEIAPYDAADAAMIEAAHAAISAAVDFVTPIYFHPTSANVERILGTLSPTIPVISTETLYENIDYQPLNLAESLGRLRFAQASTLDTNYLSFRDIVVLDAVPNDISVVSGIITEAFQTPLSHINVLSQNRNTPNMGLRGATTNTELLALDGKWVRLDVNALDWTIEEVSQEEADIWWEARRPPAVQIPSKDLSVTGLVDMADVLEPGGTQLEQITNGIPAFGGKASHYAALAQISTVRSPRAFVIPISYYEDFMETNGFNARITALLEDAEFVADPATRDAALLQLRTDMVAAPMDATLIDLLTTKINTEWPGIRMRFRSSTNAEDLDGFTGAGLYTSKSGDPNDPTRPIEDAIRTVWSSVWFFRAFEERSYRSIAHLAVGMAVLVHRSFPDETSNGVAITANIFDTTGLEPGFFINVQLGDVSVVKPSATMTTDQILYQFDRPGQPAIYLGHSNLVPEGSTVLDITQLYVLGQALADIHTHFFQSYGPPLDNPTAFYGMDVEFKFDQEAWDGTGESVLFVKQARPHPGRGE